MKTESEIRIPLDLHPAQDAFLHSPARFRGFVGGRGSGKTFVGALDLITRAGKIPGLYAHYAPTYPMLQDSSWRMLLRISEDLYHLRQVNRSDMRLILRNGSEILCRSVDEPERARGPNLFGAWLDEASLMRPEVYPIVLGCLREGEGWLSATFTPKGKKHWTYEVFAQGRRDVVLIHARTEDNFALPREFLEAIRAQYPERLARQELDGEFISLEGTIYDEFAWPTHVRDRSGPWREVIAGVDVGYTNPSAILVIGLDEDGRAHVLDEFYRRRVLQGDLIAEAKRLQAVHGISAFYVDPSAAGFLAEMRAEGLPALPANHAVLPGILEVKARLMVAGDGRPRLTISPTCVNTIQEIEAYCWKEGRTDEPERQYDHACDALRYALFSVAHAGGIRVGVVQHRGRGTEGPRPPWEVVR